METHGIERSLADRVGQVFNRRLILADRIFVVVFEGVNLCTNGVQPIVIRIRAFCAFKKALRLLKRRHVYQRLCGTHLQFGIFRKPIGCLGISFRGFFLPPGKPIGISQLWQRLRVFADCFLQSRNGLIELPCVTIEGADCA